MKINLFYHVVLILILGLVTSCEKFEKEKTFETNNLDDVYVDGDILVFKDVNAFNKTLNTLMTKSPDEISEWELKIGYKNSFRRAFEDFQRKISDINSRNEFDKLLSQNQSLVYLDKDSSVVSIYKSPLLSLVINEKGQFRIGKEINIITKDDKWITAPIDFQLKGDINFIKSDSLKEIKVLDMNKISKSKSNINSMSSTTSSLGFGIVKEELKLGSSRRLFIRLHNDYNPNNGAGSIYYSMLQQSKKIWGWDANLTNYSANTMSYNMIYNTKPMIGPVLPVLVRSLGSVPNFTRNDFRGTVFISIVSLTHYGIYAFRTEGFFSSGGVPGPWYFSLDYDPRDIL